MMSDQEKQDYLENLSDEISEAMGGLLMFPRKITCDDHLDAYNDLRHRYIHVVVFDIDPIWDRLPENSIPTVNWLEDESEPAGITVSAPYRSVNKTSRPDDPVDDDDDAIFEMSYLHSIYRKNVLASKAKATNQTKESCSNLQRLWVNFKARVLLFRIKVRSIKRNGCSIQIWPVLAIKDLGRPAGNKKGRGTNV